MAKCTNDYKTYLEKGTIMMHVYFSKGKLTSYTLFATNVLPVLFTPFSATICWKNNI